MTNDLTPIPLRMGRHNLGIRAILGLIVSDQVKLTLVQKEQVTNDQK